MSIPRKGTVFSKLTFEDKEYSSFSNPLSDEIREKIQIYKKTKNLPYSSAPWVFNKYRWIVEDGKLYLNYIHLLDDDKDNCIKEIVGNVKIFASWVNEDVKLLLSKQDIEKIRDNFTELELKAINTKGRALVQRDIKVLSFTDGQLTRIEEKITERYVERRLHDYIEE